MANTNQNKQDKLARKLEKERLNALKMLEASYLMYENTLKEYEKEALGRVDKDGNPIYSEDTVQDNRELIENMQKNVVEQYIQYGGNKEDLLKLKDKKKTSYNREHLKQLMEKETQRDEMREYFESMRQNEYEVTPTNNDKPVYTTYADEDLVKKEVKKKMVEKTIEEQTKRQTIFDGNTNHIERMQGHQMYDIVKLPSKGQCYKHKKDCVKVAYLTAYDENMILSPNLYKDGTFLDYLLEKKVIDADINPNELVQGDRDAIIIWLRATGYGVEYPIVVTDDVTRKEFETTVNLSEINYKPFNLKGDDNGHFTFTMPQTGDIIKFRYLTQEDTKRLQKMKESDSKKIGVVRLRQYTSDMIDLIEDNDLISKDAKLKIKSATSSVLDEINKNYDSNNDFSFSHELTDKLIMQTVSINNIRDYDYIKNYILNMNVRDAKAYRTYMRDNEPGVDYNITVERPLSLGGGSIKSFLQLDQFIFVTV